MVEGELINKNVFQWGEGGAYSNAGAYWKESTKSNHYGTRIIFYRLCTEAISKFFVLEHSFTPIFK